MPNFHVAYRSDDELYGLAHGILSRWGVESTYPIEIEDILERKEKILCLPSARIARLCDSGGATSLDRSTIYVDRECYFREQDQFRLRMTVAHEFAHIKLHSHILGAIHSDNDMKDLVEYFTETPGSFARYEIQAFTLGGCLLVPDQTLTVVTKKTVEVLRVKAAGTLDLGREAIWNIIANDVARKYEVTPKVIRKRLQYSGLWCNDI